MFGSRPAIVAWFVSSVVGFLPDLKGRGIRLIPPVNILDNAVIQTVVVDPVGVKDGELEEVVDDGLAVILLALDSLAEGTLFGTS